MRIPLLPLAITAGLLVVLGTKSLLDSRDPARMAGSASPGGSRIEGESEIRDDSTAPTLTKEQEDAVYAMIGQPLPTRPQDQSLSGGFASTGSPGRRIATASGTLLAGRLDAVPYLTFDPDDFKAAQKTDRTILLVFYSSWCTLCRQEEPFLFKGVDSMNTDTLILFRVNFRDEDTTEAENALALRYGVLAQPSKVILHPGGLPRPDYGMWGRHDVLLNLRVLAGIS